MKKPTNKNRISRLFILAVIAVLTFALLLTGCSDGGSGGTSEKSPLKTVLEKYPLADMSGYSGLEGYDKELAFVDVTMDDVDSLMQSKSTFLLFAGFANCPWCNALAPRLNDVALEEGALIAYLDTRKKPEWTSNIEIDGYDKFKEYFGEYLDKDDNGEPHLYVPDTYFIKDGVVVYRHSGVTPGLSSPSDEWTDELIEEVETSLKEGFDKLK